jgi:hypothetical protein
LRINILWLSVINAVKVDFFFKVGSNGICKECERITILQAEEQQIQERIAKLQADFSIDERQFLKKIAKVKAAISILEKSYNEIKDKRYALYQKIADKAKKDALSQISSQIDIKNSELQAIIGKVKENQKLLESKFEECSQSDKKIFSNASKLHKIQTLFKSMQYSIKRYFDEEAFSKEILVDNLPNEAEELLSTTITLKLHKKYRSIYDT